MSATATDVKAVTPEQAKEPEKITMTPKAWEEFHNLEQKKLAVLDTQLGTFKDTITKMIETFKPKVTEIPSSTVIEPGMTSMVKEAFDAATNELAKVINREAKWAHWKMDKEKWLGELDIDKLAQKKIEAVTMTAPINFDRKIIAVPGGRFRVPLRQFCDVKPTSMADRFTWFKGDSFDFAAITEGSAPSDTTVTLTQVTGTPATRGVLVKVNYSTVESAPADILNYINDRGTLAAIDDESADIISVGTQVATPTNWVNGNTGAEITADTTFGTTNTLTITGVAAARRLVDDQGYGLDYTLITNPKAYFDLLVSSGIDKFVQQGVPQIVASGILEQLIGCRIVVAKKAAGGDSTSKRSLLVTPGQTLGLVTMRELMFEADRRNELQQIFVTPTQRIKTAVLDEKSSCRVSTSGT
jgi:HK97 family phage major capsid protein